MGQGTGIARPTILLTDPVSPSVRKAAEASARVIQCGAGDEVAFRRAISEAHGIIVRSYLPQNAFDDAPNLLVAVRHGAGADLIPLQNADANGVAVATVPGANGAAVAEFALAQMISLSRKIPQLERILRVQGWDAARAQTSGGREINGKTIGIVGLGSVGGQLARMCHFGLGMRVLGNQRRLNHVPDFVQPASLPTLFSESDFVVLCCPLTAETKGMVGAEMLALMKSSAFLINVARGPVVDQGALLDALRHKAIAGAALDVFEVEPVASDDPVLGLDNVLATPHCSGISQESAVTLGMGALAEIQRVLAGEPPRSFVNPSVWEHTCAKRAKVADAESTDRAGIGQAI